MVRRFVALAAALATLGACNLRDTSPAQAPAPASAEAPAVAPTSDEPVDEELAAFIRRTYDKREVRVPMRDGTELFTAIYTPKRSRGPVPIMLFRTPYSVGPYGADKLPERLGPNPEIARKGWIFAYQDVRGRFMSGGQFVDMRPHIDNKTKPEQIDESSDTYDTIEWLLANVTGHNGKVGQWGISYPGFYSAAGMIDAHPALRAVSPQAPIADWFFDDMHHHGAFFLPHTFNFFAVFGRPRPQPTTEWGPRFDHGTPDGYDFFLRMGPLSNANTKYLKGEIGFWNDLVAHPNYDEFWQARNLLPHLSKVAPAVLTVGGWFDAEDLYGPLHIYAAIEERNPGIHNTIVMGPWSHGAWARTEGRRLGPIDFGADTSKFYRDEIETPFFEHHLAGGPPPDLAEATVFETGSNRWRRFETWPPKATVAYPLYLEDNGSLASAPPTESRGFDSWVSDPNKPVPYTTEITTNMTKEYMVEDQRFAARRPDVVTYTTEPLTEAVTIAGPITAHLWVSTSGTDSDWVVKIIDVLPDDAKMPAADGGEPKPVGGYAMMVRSEVIRGRFREGYDRPRRMLANTPTAIDLPLQDVLHTFGPGHRIMVQIQSTWFPLVDRNPHRYAPNVFEAKASDFVPATQRVYRSKTHPTWVEMQRLPAG